MKYILLTFLLCPLVSFGQSTINFKYGVGILQSAQKSNSDSAFGSLSYQTPIKGSLYHQVESGLWTSRARDLGQKMSGFLSHNLGLKLNLGPCYIESMHGLGFITTPDSLLGGRFQFFHDVGFGAKDKVGSAFGVQIKHISSAGLEKPNIGRNFLLIKISFGI